MARSIFGVVASSISLPKESILQVATRLHVFFQSMSKIDSCFCTPNFVGKNDHDLYELDVNNPNFINQLADLILKYAKGDISTHEKVNKPTVDFSRDFGFKTLFTIKNQSARLFSVFTNLGGDLGGGISLNTFNRDLNYDFNWYYSMLKGVVNQLDAGYGLVSFSSSSLNDEVVSLKVKFHLGWITYVSDTNPVKIPGDLPGLEYERDKNGVYMITTREDFSSDKELYNMQIKKLLSLMAEIKSRVPEYSKD